MDIDMNSKKHPAQWECDWIGNNLHHYNDDKHARDVKQRIMRRVAFQRATIYKNPELFKLVALKDWLVGYREGIGPTFHHRTAYELLDVSTNKTIGFISVVCALNNDTVEILNDLKRKQGVQEFKTFEGAVTAAGLDPQSRCVRAARELIDSSIDYESLFLSKSERGFYVSLNISINEIVVTYNLPLGNTVL